MTPAIWLSAMTRVRAELKSQSVSSAIDRADAMTGAVSEAEAALAGALSHETRDPHTVIAELLDRASRLLTVASDLCGTGNATGGARQQTAAALTSELRFLEDAILEGELTYQLDTRDLRRPLNRAAHALTSLGDATRVGVGDQIALRTASAELAALLVRAAANLETTGDAQHGTAPGSDSLSATVKALVLQAAKSADALPSDRRTTSPEDSVGRRLCESLRVPVDLSSLDALTERASADGSRQNALEAARRGWLALAAREYAVASSLDAQLPTLEYKLRFGSLSNAIEAGAINVLCGARLLLRPHAFRHRRAWGRQGIALSHAIEAYINGLRGNREAVARAQLIVMSRLVRSVAALALVDAERHNLTFGDIGNARR
jgi:hypothetical protein